MSAFNNPTLREVGEVRGRHTFEIVEPLEFAANMPNGGAIRVTVPAGFRTDFASVPRILWPIFPPYGQYTRAAILHDYLCEQRGKCSRFLADAIFREAMRQLKVPVCRRVAMYYAVRFYGALTRWEL